MDGARFKPHFLKNLVNILVQSRLYGVISKHLLKNNLPVPGTRYHILHIMMEYIQLRLPVEAKCKVIPIKQYFTGCRIFAPNLILWHGCTGRTP